VAGDRKIEAVKYQMQNRRIRIMFHESASPNRFEGDSASTKKWLCYFLCIVMSLLFGKAAYSIEPAEEKSNADVLVRVGDEVITQKDLEAVLNKIPEKLREKYRDKTLDRLIEVKVFADEARKAGLDKDPGAKESVQKATNETLARYFVKKDIDVKSEPSKEEMEKYYSEHKEQFVLPEGVLIQQIVAKNKEDAEAILEELKNGVPFGEMAKKKSIVSSWKNEGRLGWLYKGRMDPDMEKAAFDLKKEKLSDIIKTKEGYQIIKVLEKSDKRDITFEEAKSYIHYELFWKKKNALINTYYEKAKVDRKPAEKDVLFKIGDESFKEELLAPVLIKVQEKDREKARKQWIDYLIETTVFSREAREAGMEKDAEVVDELKRKTDEILANVFQKKFIMDKFKVSDTEAADYYHAHPEEFTIPEKVRARAVIMKTQEDAEMIKAEIEKGVAFDSLAAKDTGYYDKLETVDMGWFGKGEKDPLIEKAAFSLKKGEVSDIIKTDKGYLILTVLEKGGGEVKPFAEVKELIKMKVMMPKFQEAKQQYYEKAGVKILKEKVN
jgi:peptidyl-prolyl cis-trans isomerase C